MTRTLFSVIFLCFFVTARSQSNFNGLDMNMGNLFRLSDAQTRSISPENFTGEKGKGGMAVPNPNAPVNEANATHAARDLGQGWKVNPFVRIAPGETFTLAEIEGPGSIQHIWMTPTGNWRFSVIRFYWDDEETPSVEVPVGDFFAMGWNQYAPLSSLAVCGPADRFCLAQLLLRCAPRPSFHEPRKGLSHACNRRNSVCRPAPAGRAGRHDPDHDFVGLCAA